MEEEEEEKNNLPKKIFCDEECTAYLQVLVPKSITERLTKFKKSSGEAKWRFVAGAIDEKLKRQGF